MRRFGKLSRLCLTVIGLAGLAAEARADVLVVDSRGAKVQRGAVLKDGASLEVPAGGSVAVLLPNGNTRSLRGPAKVQVRELTKGAPIDRAAWRNVESLIRPVAPAAPAPMRAAKEDKAAGGEEGGITRGLGGGSGAVARGILSRFSWHEVPIDADGDYCVERGAKLTLVRPSGARTDAVTVVDVKGGARAEASFARGKDSTAWPAEIGVKVGTYALLAPERRHEITLRLIAPIPEPDATLRVLAGQKCRLQAEAWLRTLATS